MTDIDLKEAELTLRAKYNENTEADKKPEVAYYNVSLTGANGLKALGRVMPDALRESLGEIVDAEVRRRLEAFRGDIEGALKDAQASVSDARTTFAERSRTAFSKLGIGRVTPEPKKEASPPTA